MPSTPLRILVACRAATVLALLPGIPLGCSQPPPLPPPPIVLITLDTTRTDHLGLYGYARDASPNLDRLAAESVVYTDALATSSWTLPSHASLFTGKFPTSHGARYDPEGPLRLMDAIEGEPGWDRYRVRGLARDEVTLARLLREAGYATGAVVAGPWMKRIFGLDAGFEFYDDEDIGDVAGRLADQVTDRALEWLASLEGRRFFLFLNYYDPHVPYTPPDGFGDDFLSEVGSGPGADLQKLHARYDGEIRYMDHHIGRLLEALREKDVYDETWIIVTADHGELLGEHGVFGHGSNLYQEELRIPLFAKYPAGEAAPVRIATRIQLTDVLPLVCRRLGLPLPGGVQGEAPPRIRHPVVAETYPLEGLEDRGAGHWRALFEAEYKLLWNSLGRHKLFNLRDDPEEILNLAPDIPDRVRRMEERLNTYLASLPQPAAAGQEGEVDPETRKALESLGYLE